MAVAYRVAYDSGDVTGVRMQELLRTFEELMKGGFVKIRSKLSG